MGVLNRLKTGIKNGVYKLEKCSMDRIIVIFFPFISLLVYIKEKRLTPIRMKAVACFHMVFISAI